MENVNRIIAAFIVSLSEKDTKVPIVSANTGVALKINCVDLICSKSGMPKVQEQPDDEMLVKNATIKVIENINIFIL